MSLAKPPTDFGTILLNSYTQSGLAWVQTVGCIFIIYGYSVSNQKFLWKILLAHGISGLLGIFIENFFLAKHSCCLAENWAFLLMINEVNWIIHEATTVFYSTIKLETVITNQTHKKILQGILGVSFAVFALLRLNIGRLRFSANTTMNNDIAQAHSYAFIIWGFADLIIFILLIKNTLNIGSGEVAGGLLVTLLKSSLPRIMILVINTFVIVILGQLSSPLSTAMNNLNSLAWSIKGAYPILLMFDMHTTKDMLLMKQSKMTGSSEMTSAPAKSFHNSQRSVNVFNPPSYPSTANPSAYV